MKDIEIDEEKIEGLVFEALDNLYDKVNSSEEQIYIATELMYITTMFLRDVTSHEMTVEGLEILLNVLKEQKVVSEYIEIGTAGSLH